MLHINANLITTKNAYIIIVYCKDITCNFAIGCIHIKHSWKSSKRKHEGSLKGEYKEIPYSILRPIGAQNKAYFANKT